MGNISNIINFKMVQQRKYTYQESQIETDPKCHVQNRAEKNISIRIDPAELPSSRFKYNRWTDIPQISIKGPDLNAPRIREAPKELNPNQADKPYRIQMENGEQTETLNFCNQELSQEFQIDNFGDCLNRAKIAKLFGWKIIIFQLSTLSSKKKFHCHLVLSSTQLIITFNLLLIYRKCPS